jgi:hypothetical protein
MFSRLYNTYQGLMFCRLTKLKQLLRQFDIPTIRKPLPKEVARQLVVDEAEKDITQRNGLEYVRVKLRVTVRPVFVFYYLMQLCLPPLVIMLTPSYLSDPLLSDDLISFSHLSFYPLTHQLLVTVVNI